MNSTALRLYAVVAIVAVTYGIASWVQAQVEPPGVEMPNWTFREMPLQLGEWQGEDTELDPKIAAATGAKIIVDRLYRNDLGRAVSLHTAMFDDPSEGVYHSPLNCYVANGWTKTNETLATVHISDDRTLPVKLITWQKEGETVMVVYWYQLGENVLYGRLDLGKLRFTTLRGQEKWPALVKVMIQISAIDVLETEAVVLEFADCVAQWLNQPKHQEDYLGRWPAN